MSKKIFKTKPIEDDSSGHKIKKNNYNDKELAKFFSSGNYQKIEKPSNLSRALVLSLVVAALVGFWAGLIGQLFVFSGASKIFGLDLEMLLSPSQVVIKKEEKTYIKEKEQLQKIIQETNSQVVGIFLEKPQTKDALASVYLPKDLLGSGVILTSDGWLLATSSVVPSDKDSYLVIIQNQIYKVKKIIQDFATEAVFLKIEARDLPVIKLGELKSLNLGEEVIVLGSSLSPLKITRIATKRHMNIETPYEMIESSERFSKRIFLEELFSKKFEGSPLVNLSGEVIGIISTPRLDKEGENKEEVNTALPLDYLKKTLNSLLKKGEIELTYLGVNSIDLSFTFGLPESLTQKYENGALLISLGDKKAVEEESPADKAGLKEGDIILKIENELVNRRKDLTEYIQDYSPGQKITLTIVRDGKEKVVEVELGRVIAGNK